MNKEERNVQINNFLKKWNEMMDEANKIEDFKWRFEVSITSDDNIIEELMYGADKYFYPYCCNNKHIEHTNSTAHKIK